MKENAAKFRTKNEKTLMRTSGSGGTRTQTRELLNLYGGEGEMHRRVSPDITGNEITFAKLVAERH
jgi:hypothetical protein